VFDKGIGSFSVESALKALISAVEERNIERALEIVSLLEKEALNTSLWRALNPVIAALKTVRLINSPYTWSYCDSAVKKLKKELSSR